MLPSSVFAPPRDAHTTRSRPGCRIDCSRYAIGAAWPGQTARRGIAEAANRSLQRSLDILHIYDRAFSGLTDRNKPLEFRDFLIEAPQLFSELGEMLSVLHHVVSFWNYRTANALVVRITADELCDIVADFAEGLALSCPVPFVPGAEATPRRPTARQSAA